MRFKNLILEKYIFWFLLFLVGIAFAEYMEALPFLQFAKISVVTFVSYFLLGCLEFITIVFVTTNMSVDPFWRIYRIFEIMLTCWVVLDLVIAIVSHRYFYEVSSIATIAGFVSYPRFLMYIRHRKLRKLCLFFEKAPDDQKKIVIQHSNFFLNAIPCFSTVTQFEDGVSIEFEVLNFGSLLQAPNLSKTIINEFPESIEIFLIAMKRICLFIEERCALIQEDKEIYTEGVVVDATIVQRRNRLENQKNLFKTHWGIDAL